MSIMRRFKSVRNNLMERYFLWRRAEGFEAFIQEQQNSGHANLCFSIAFNTPWVIDYQTRLWKKYVADASLAVIDNSTSRTASAEIKSLCASRKIPYLKLPHNLDWHPNRHHGKSINWIFYNIVRVLQPIRFGFVDHDCFPIARFSLEEQFAGKKIYGLKHGPFNGFPQWSLWAGFAFMDFDFVKHRKLDFAPLFHMGLDTGGSNWFDLYSRVGQTEARFAGFERLTHHQENMDCPYELIDSCFMHIGGASYSTETTRDDHVLNMQKLLDSTYLRTSSDGIQESDRRDGIAVRT